MATVYEIPLTPSQNQKMSISLNGVSYNLVFNWVNADQGGWTIDINDSNDNAIVQGIPLTTGADLLAQLKYLNLGGGLVVETDGEQTDVPTFDNLGQQSHLYYVIPTP